MKFIEYINGRRHGREANHLEREAMRDPFMQDALDGYDAVEGDHGEALQRLWKRLPDQARDVRAQVRRRRETQRWLMAAAFFGVIVTGCWMLWRNRIEEVPVLVAEELATEVPPLYDVQEVPVPEPVVAVVEENIQVVDNNMQVEAKQIFVDLAQDAGGEYIVEAAASRAEEDIVTMEDVVVVGSIPERPKETFTGSAIVFAHEPLRRSKRVRREKAAESSVVLDDSLRATEAFSRYLNEISPALEVRVVLEFWSDNDGRPTKIRAVESPSADRGARQAAIRLLRESPVVWPPKKTMKVAVE